ncbi:HMP-PP phosphatase [Deinococcus carri]|uniref:HMP-PP phosphatase n=1 Tax=Deinococcus carri TaxID=1211323 RepID=A0ABP9W7N3_9DEIO
MRLLAFDLDDTLLDPHGQVPEATVTVLEELRRAGWLVAVITARWHFPAVLEARLRPEAVATSNGAAIEVRGQRLVRHTLPRTAAQAILDACPAEANIKAFSAEKRFGDVSYSTPERPVFSLTEAREAELVKLRVAHEAAPSLRAQFQNTPGLSISGGEGQRYAGKVSFTPEAAHKGEALRTIAQALGIPLGDCVAFGDSDSDLPMLRLAGLGVQVGDEACLRDVRGHQVCCAVRGMPQFLRALALGGLPLRPPPREGSRKAAPCPRPLR